MDSLTSFRTPKLAAILAALIFAAAAGGPAAAHHSYGMFDRNTTKTIKGTVSKFDWTNPHSWVHVVSMDKGASTTWDVEMGPPVSLSRIGLKRSSLKSGDHIEITIAPLKDGSPGGHLVEVKTADGQVFKDGTFSPGQGTGPAQGKDVG